MQYGKWELGSHTLAELVELIVQEDLVVPVARILGEDGCLPWWISWSPGPRRLPGRCGIEPNACLPRGLLMAGPAGGCAW